MDRLAHTVGEQPQGAKRMLDARTGWGHPRQHPGATWIALRCGLLSMKTGSYTLGASTEQVWSDGARPVRLAGSGSAGLPVRRALDAMGALVSLLLVQVDSGIIHNCPRGLSPASCGPTVMAVHMAEHFRETSPCGNALCKHDTTPRSAFIVCIRLCCTLRG
jgi:hypothetical protein